MQNMRKLTKGICINDTDQCTLATYVEYAVDRACQALNHCPQMMYRVVIQAADNNFAPVSR
jgi:hypothetical protein